MLAGGSGGARFVLDSAADIGGSMRSRFIKACILASAILALPRSAYAQEALLSGSVVDSTGSILPGVTVKAENEASGNTFEAVTDSRGAYRVPVRIGVYTITAVLQGFNKATRVGIEVQVGQTQVINLQLAPAGVAESVTVSATAPLIEVGTSSLGGNIDPRQMQELPSQGRNWMSLVLLAPGNRTNDQGKRHPVPALRWQFLHLARIDVAAEA